MSIALVAGGTSGIGLATARRLQQRGYDVHVTGRGKERLDDVASSDPELTGHQADGGDATAMAALAESLGTVDVLVVSLSGTEGMGPIDSLDLAVLRRAFDAKFWAHLTTIQAVLPHLAADGSITLLSAITARAAMAGTAGIGALNAAIEALVKPLAVELAPRRVNAVSPGFFHSSLIEESPVTFFNSTRIGCKFGSLAPTSTGPMEDPARSHALPNPVPTARSRVG